MARCVIAVGIPLPSFVDPQVSQKRIFNDRMRAQNNSKTISGSDWYKMEGYRALNQALGRWVLLGACWNACEWMPPFQMSSSPEGLGGAAAGRESHSGECQAQER